MNEDEIQTEFRSNTERLRTLLLMQQHQTMLSFTLLEMADVRRQVANGFLGNAVSHETKVKLHIEAIQQLARTL